MPDPGPARVALVTGAGQGIGRELALGLAGDGLAVGMLGRTAGSLERVAAEVGELGARAAIATADVRDLGAVRSAVEAIETVLGGVEVLVNNAAAIENEEVPVWEAEPQRWWDVVETDLRGPFHLVRAVVPGMLHRGGGRVIDLNSGSGADDRPNYSAYCAAKAALFRIGGNVHLRGYEQGMRHFQVAPGVVDTPMTATMPIHDTRIDWTPPRRVVDLVLAIAAGALDSYSGRFLQARVDDVGSLRAAAASGLGPHARRLTVHAYGPDDPLFPQRA